MCVDLTEADKRLANWTGHFFFIFGAVICVQRNYFNDLWSFLFDGWCWRIGPRSVDFWWASTQESALSSKRDKWRHRWRLGHNASLSRSCIIWFTCFCWSRRWWCNRYCRTPFVLHRSCKAGDSFSFARSGGSSKISGYSFPFGRTNVLARKSCPSFPFHGIIGWQFRLRSR